MNIMTYSKDVMEMTDIITRRSLPFTEDTLQQLRFIRGYLEDLHYEETGEDIVIPMPIAIKVAVDKYFNLITTGDN